jgi:hypothetical protein
LRCGRHCAGIKIALNLHTGPLPIAPDGHDPVATYENISVFCNRPVSHGDDVDARHVTARTLLAETPELGTLDRRKIAALAGLAPYTQSSGKWKGKSFIAGGRSRVRAVLYMAAMTAIRANSLLKDFLSAAPSRWRKRTPCVHHGKV